MALASLGRDPPPFFRQGPSALSRLALFSALALLLMVADARFQMMQPLRATIATAMYPLQWLALQPLQLSQTLNARANAWMANDNAVRVLGEQLISERQRSQQSGQLSLENQRLRSLLELRALPPMRWPPRFCTTQPTPTRAKWCSTRAKTRAFSWPHRCSTNAACSGR